MKKSLFALLLFSIASHAGFSLDYYWVDGSGNWNDKSHWSAESGGQANVGIPTSSDNVYFDNNSFDAEQQVLYINGQANCNNLYWRSSAKTAILDGDSLAGLNIYGSAFFDGNISPKFPGQIAFLSSKKKNQIATANLLFHADLLFNGKAEWHLQGPLQTDAQHSIILASGTLITNDHRIYCGNLVNRSNAPKKLELGNSEVLIRNSIDIDTKNNFAVSYEQPTIDIGQTVQSSAVKIGDFGGVVLKSANPCGVPPNDFTLTITAVTDFNGEVISCNGADDGEILVSVAGGVGPFSYQWVGGPATPNYAGIGAGTYTVIVEDLGQGGLSCNESMQVTEPADLALAFITTGNPSCNGVCDGTANPVVVGGTGALDYLWSSGETTINATMLCDGANTMQVTDANDCVLLEPINLTAPDSIAPNVVVTDISCFGEDDGEATSTPTGGNGGYLFAWLPGGEATPTISDLEPGNYTVTVTDALGCTGDTTVTVNEPTDIDPNESSTDASCNGSCDGTATVAPVGGAGGYLYNWEPDPPVGEGTSSASGLCAGTWEVTITDGTGCDTTVEFVIGEPSAIDPNEIQTNASCFGECDGTATVAPVGGAGGYLYDWEPDPPAGEGTTTATGLCAGDWDLTITDGSGCDTTITFTITEPTEIDPNESFTDASCFGDCDGTATVAPVGGAGGYLYDWEPDPPAGEGTTTASGLCAGTWEVTITDGSGCDTTVSIVVGEPTAIDPNATSTDMSCGGTCDGTATVVPTGGAGGYLYDWTPDPPTGGDGFNFASDLCAGAISVRITDASGCDTVVNFVINAPSSIDPNEVQTNASCFGECDGTATVAPVGGAGGYLYDWTPDPPAGEGTNSASGLCAGNWSLTITDAAGCDTTIDFTITEPSEIDPNPVSTDVVCFGDCDGTATVTPVGGAGGYLYDWDPDPPAGEGTNAATGLCAGTWTVTITDASGCDTVHEFTIDEPDDILPNESSTNASCFEECDGTATVAPVGGAGGYLYDWTPDPPAGEGTASASGLCAGVWEVEITDAAGCDTTVTFTITEPTEILPNENSTNVSCFSACDGTASVTPAGGAGGYLYDWTPDPPSGDGTNSASGLCAGNWTVLITDVTGCDTLVEFNITEPTEIEPNEVISDASCFALCDGSAIVNPVGGAGDYSYDWDPDPPAGEGTNTATGLCVGNWNVTITDISGCDTVLEFTINEPTEIIPNESSNDATCFGVCNGNASVAPAGGAGGYMYNWTPEPGGGQGTPIATDICAGINTVLITDITGCDTLVTFNIGETAPLFVNGSQTNASCFGSCDGTASAAASGGTGDYSYVWNPAPGGGQGTANATGLCAGDWTVTVTDNISGCFKDSTFTITEPTQILPNDSSSDITCNGLEDGVAQVTPTGGAGGYTYDWTPDPPIALQDADSIITNLTAGVWSVLITDVTGCDTTVAITVAEPTEIDPNESFSGTTCNGVCDGTATVAPTGGTGSTYTYLWNPVPPAGQGTATASDLCAGIWEVTITDSLGCDTVVEFNIPEPTSIDPDPSSTNVTCRSAGDGTATVNPSGGTPAMSGAPYTYLWNPEPGGGQGTATATDLGPGTWEVTVTDSLGCDTTVSFEITQPTLISGFSTTINSDCGVCNGTMFITPSGGTPGYTYQWNDPAGIPIPGATDSTLADRCAGLYSVVVTDANMCTRSFGVSLSNNGGEIVNINSTNPVCNGICNGTATAIYFCSDPPCDVVWYDDTPAQIGQTGDFANDLCAGDYFAYLTNGSGCLTITPVTITEPSEILGPLEVEEISCNGECDATIAVLTTGGTPGYTYQWVDAVTGLDIVGETDSILTDRCQGEYYARITDSFGCPEFSDTAIIAEPAVLSSVFSNIVDLTCGSVCEGSATINVSGGTRGYTFQWFDAATDVAIAGATDSVATDLCAGDYYVEVLDTNGCAHTSADVTIGGPDLLSIDTTIVNSTCGLCDGSITVTPSGGTPGYTYQWYDHIADTAIAGETDSILSNRCAGVYRIEIIDGNLCGPDSFAIALSDSDGELVDTDSTDVDCNGNCNGTATVNFVCSDPPCVITWFDSGTGMEIGQDSTTAIDLCGGTYFAEVENNAGCVSIATVTVNEPDELLVSAVDVDILCGGDSTGEIDLTITGGTLPYDIDWSGPGGFTSDAEDLTDLPAGTYDLTLTDANSCATALSVEISEPAILEIDTQIVDATCGFSDGDIIVTPTGGIPGYSYQWYDNMGVAIVGETDSSLLDVSSGIYSVEITDANLCLERFVLGVSDSDAEVITMEITDVDCNGNCTGEAIANYVCSDPPCLPEWYDATTGLSLGVFSDTARDLCAGDYYIQVTNNTLCLTIVPATIGEPSALTTSLLEQTEITCNGECDGELVLAVGGGTPDYTYQWFDAGTGLAIAGETDSLISDLCTGSYYLQVTDANSCVHTSDTFALAEPSVLSLVFDNTTDASCFNVNDGAISITASGGNSDYTYAWSGPNNFSSTDEDLTGLFPGTYIVQVTDSNNCTLMDSTVVDTITIVVADAGQDTSACVGETIVLRGNGGVTYEWRNLAGTLLGTADTLIASSSVGVSSYVLTAIEAPCSDMDTVVVTIVDVPDVEAGDDVSIFEGNQAVIGGSPTGPSNSTYLWVPGSGLSDSTAANPSASPDETTLYLVFVTSEEGCIATDSVLVTILPGIDFPSGFSPNNDGVNEFWNIINIEEFPNAVVLIYSRWGELLFESEGYDEPWDGTFNGQPLPVGTYYYIIDLKDENFPEVLTGPVTILR